MNNLTVISASDLKKHTAEILNQAHYSKKVFLVQRYGVPIVKIEPVENQKIRGKLSPKS